MAATALAYQISGNGSSISSLLPKNSSVLRIGLCMQPTTTSSKRIYVVRASSDPPKERANSAEDKAAFVSQDDLKYLMELGAGSIAGAAAIKYGSIVFPEITRPDLVQALLMISAPVIVAVSLLIKQSRAP